MSSPRSRSGGHARAGTRSAGRRGPRGTAPRRTAPRRSRFVAATTRTSTLRVRVPPTGSNSPSCSTRRSLPCSSSGSSPISSRKSVPPSAASKRPVAPRVAPVKAPRSWPKSSLSISAGGDGGAVHVDERLARGGGCAAWMARATSSLPVPVSPRMSTVASAGATWRTSASAWRSEALFPRISPERPRSRSSVRRYSASLVRVAIRRSASSRSSTFRRISVRCRRRSSSKSDSVPSARKVPPPASAR